MMAHDHPLAIGRRGRAEDVRSATLERSVVRCPNPEPERLSQSKYPSAASITCAVSSLSGSVRIHASRRADSTRLPRGSEDLWGSLFGDSASDTRLADTTPTYPAHRTSAESALIEPTVETTAVCTLVCKYLPGPHCTAHITPRAGQVEFVDHMRMAMDARRPSELQFLSEVHALGHHRAYLRDALVPSGSGGPSEKAI